MTRLDNSYGRTHVLDNWNGLTNGLTCLQDHSRPNFGWGGTKLRPFPLDHLGHSRQPRPSRLNAKRLLALNPLSIALPFLSCS